MTHGNYLTAGLAYAFHPHRDTWFSAPPCQLNWWLPVYDIGADNTIAFLPRYWSKPIANSSREYNYYKWNQESRRAAATQIKTDTRKQPQALEPIDMDSQIRVVCKAGGIIFFPAHICTRRSRTRRRARDSASISALFISTMLLNGAGRQNIDSECTGTTLRDFLRASDSMRLPDEIAEQSIRMPHDQYTANSFPVDGVSLSLYRNLRWTCSLLYGIHLRAAAV